MLWIGEDLEHQLMIVQGRHLEAPKVYQFHSETENWYETRNAANGICESHNGSCQANLQADLLAFPSGLSDVKIIRVKVRLQP